MLDPRTEWPHAIPRHVYKANKILTSPSLDFSLFLFHLLNEQSDFWVPLFKVWNWVVCSGSNFKRTPLDFNLLQGSLNSQIQSNNKHTQSSHQHSNNNRANKITKNKTNMLLHTWWFFHPSLPDSLPISLSISLSVNRQRTTIYTCSCVVVSLLREDQRSKRNTVV